MIDTIVDHYNLIAHQLTEPGRYAPMLMRTDEGEVLAGDWADGFYGAMSLTLQEWAPLLSEKQTGEPLMGILIQCTNPDLTDMISTAFPKPSEAMLKEAWRAILLQSRKSMPTASRCASIPRLLPTTDSSHLSLSLAMTTQPDPTTSTQFRRGTLATDTVSDTELG